MNWLIRLGSISREFLRALGRGHTYNVFKNSYVIFGILWGIPVPIVTIGIGIYFSGVAPTVSNIISHVISYPIHIFFLLHPVLFAVVFGAMGTIRDEKERQRLEFESNLIKTNEELKKLDELKDSFVSMVSHELLSPVTTIQGYITFLKGVVTEEQRESLEIAEEEADHLINLVEELMDLSKIEAGEFEVNPGPVDIGNVVNRIINRLKPAIEEKVLVIENRLPQELPAVLADEKRIIQVFTNLIGNAIKFTPSGGKISIYSKEMGNKLIFCVEDTGIGIPKENLNRIFDRFYQVDSTSRRRYGGCGLGLTITKRIIELHKGRIWAESEEGRGSRFCFELERYDKTRRGAEYSTV